MILILGFVLIKFAYNPFIGIQNSLINSHNSKIDYSCNVDSDCKVKFVGSIRKCNGQCDASYDMCVNVNSIEGTACHGQSGIFSLVCSLNKPIISYCKCESKICKSYICSGDNCLTMSKWY